MRTREEKNTAERKRRAAFTVEQKERRKAEARRRYAENPDLRERRKQQARAWAINNRERVNKNAQDWKKRRRYGEITEAHFLLAELEKYLRDNHGEELKREAARRYQADRAQAPRRPPGPDLAGRAQRLPARFESYIERVEECWNWTGWIKKTKPSSPPLPRLKLGTSYVSARRVALALRGVDIPPGFCVYSTCGNDLCVNPDHCSVEKKRGRFFKL